MLCEILVSEFELCSRHCIHFLINTLGKAWPPFSHGDGLNSIPTVFYLGGFSINYPTKVDTSFNKDIKQ